jgi:hypothetical protein
MVERLKRLSRLQRLNPAREAGFEAATASFNAPASAGAQTWTCPKSGRYNVYAWGPGGRGGDTALEFAGSSGGLAIWQRVRFRKGDTVAISVPHHASTSGDTTVTTSRRPAALTGGRGGAGGGSAGAAGAATGGDVNISGSLGKTSAGNNGGGTDGGLGTSGGAPGAPGFDGLRGGDGALTGYPGGTPGAGGQGSTPGDAQRMPGQGLVIITRVG